MPNVHHPQADYSGTATIGRRTLTFTDGVAHTDGPVAGFARAGYRISATAENDQGGIVDLEAMTVPQLREHAAKHDIDLNGASRKDDIITMIVTPAEDVSDGDND